MKSNSENKKFHVLNWDFNKDEIEYYDVLPYFRKKLEERIEKSKNDKDGYFKVPKSFDELKKFIENESMYHFWSRCEYEMIVHGWPVRKKDHKIDIHEQIMMNINLICGIIFDEYTDVLN